MFTPMPEIADDILQAGRRYIAQQTSIEDCEPERDLLLALGSTSVGTLGHQRAVWLCRLATRRVLDRRGWPTSGQVADLRHALALVDGRMSCTSDPAPLEWARAGHVDDGCRAKACQEASEEYIVLVYGIAAALGRFARYAGIGDGVEVLRSAEFADSPYREIEFNC